MKTVTLPVKGLNVAGCAREIEKHLGGLPPITEVAASYVTQTVTITYDETRLGALRSHHTGGLVGRLDISCRRMACSA
jgi:copper chaperone CopZ